MKLSNFAFPLVVMLLTTATGASTALIGDLQPISRDEWRSAGIGGTGCWWSMPRGRMRFVMSEGVVVVKIGGQLTTLAPAAGSRDMFPFTYDRWRKGNLVIVVRSLGKARNTNAETISNASELEVVRQGHGVRLRGTVACGN